MSHFSLLAIGFKDESELEDFMEPYDEGRSVKPYVRYTKAELLAKGKELHEERCEIVAAFKADPIAAKKQYGERGERIYNERYKKSIPWNFKDPERYYKWYTKGELLDDDGNLLTTYNPDSKWDYYSVEETHTIADLKKLREQRLLNFDSSRCELIWDVIVEGKEIEKKASNLMLFWGVPNKENLLKIYGTKENYIECMKNNFAPTYCVLSKTTGWHEPGTVGYWGLSSATPQDEYEFSRDYYKNFIDGRDDKETVYVIDCHI